MREIHIDFLLEEEFDVDPTFLRRFIAAAGQGDSPLQTERIERSVVDQYGEADLIVVYKLEGKCEKIAILIEDKIRAGFQTCQADRYRKRGDAGNNVHWDSYWTCLVAPDSYINKADHGFHAVVALEQIKEWFAVMEPKRSEFKARVIQQALDTPPPVQKIDLAMTAFRKRYYAVFEEFFADQRGDVWMRKPGDTWSGDTWFEIRRSPVLPKGAYINHKSPTGCVDLTFPNTDAAALRKGVKPYLKEGMAIEQTGKSAAIPLSVAKIGQFKDFDRERGNVEEALSAAKRLLEFYASEGVQLEPGLKAASTAVI